MSADYDVDAAWRLCVAGVGPWAFDEYDCITNEEGFIAEIRGEGAGKRQQNGEFIAAARTGWPNALREIERLRAELQRLTLEEKKP